MGNGIKVLETVGDLYRGYEDIVNGQWGRREWEVGVMMNEVARKQLGLWSEKGWDCVISYMREGVFDTSNCSFQGQRSW